MAEQLNNLTEWEAVIPEEQWKVYAEAIRIVRKTGARGLLGGAFSLAAYTGRWRNTKDLDFFVLPSEKDKVVDALTKAGFDDYYPVLAYDRGWIYRAVRDGVIVDTIWQTPNRRTIVDQAWLERSRQGRLRNEPVEFIPAEEMLAIKLYVLQRDRCDWPDLLNLLYATCSGLDWMHILERVEKDRALLGGLLHVFNWVCPARAREIPGVIRTRFGLPEVTADELAVPETERIRLLDSRGWFAAHQPPDSPMTV